MSNIVKKTVIITALSLVAVLLLTVFGIVAFAPKTAGDICFNLGLNKSALGCYEREYKNTGEFDDLLKIVDTAIISDNDQYTIDYGTLLVSRKKEFSSYCSAEDKRLGENSKYSTHDYYTNIIMNVYFDRGDRETAVRFSLYNLPQSGYAENSALYNIVNIARGDGTTVDSEMVEIIGSVYESMSDNYFTGYVKFKDDMRKLGYKFN